MSDDPRKTKRLTIRLHSREYGELAANAQASQMDLSRYLREAGRLRASLPRLRALQQDIRQLAVCLHRIYQVHRQLTDPGSDLDTIFDQVLIIAHRIEQGVNLLPSEDDCQHDSDR
jgi:hypothetical protein